MSILETSTDSLQRFTVQLLVAVHFQYIVQMPWYMYVWIKAIHLFLHRASVVLYTS